MSQRNNQDIKYISMISYLWTVMYLRSHTPNMQQKALLLTKTVAQTVEVVGHHID